MSVKICIWVIVINGNDYEYRQWREDGSTKSKYHGPADDG
ncbi:hypothetical protein SAMN04487948_12722 [Halogranum amylolyticum]|uniref:Uncharacterized protein n=1 Tax=Halogranum amylolyticum TaxID=660520 RepID=A0A1H8WDY2_9EURY|nr:hypothetical protein SAMN04487948_12722 [Halogranum amylolyticum]